MEPVVGKINERARATGALAKFGFGSQRSEWFRTYRVSVPGRYLRFEGAHSKKGILPTLRSIRCSVLEG
jgi:hypothetical protein